MCKEIRDRGRCERCPFHVVQAYEREPEASPPSWPVPCPQTSAEVQIQSGGVGIDLTRAAYAVYYSIGFGLGDYEQSLARLHRPGQSRKTHYYHLIAEDTVDRRLYGALEKRKDLITAVLEDLGYDERLGRSDR